MGSTPPPRPPSPSRRYHHPDLQAYRANASDSYALPPWTPCRRGGAGETLAWGMDWDGGGLGWWRG
jgi:hypothetical protein